jgi:YNFM family putative membrane transporter
MALLAALGIGATLADALWLIIAGLGIFTFGFFAVHSVASAWVGHRAGPRARAGFGALSGELLPRRQPARHGGRLGLEPWRLAGVLAALLACAGLVIGIALRLRRLAGD